MEDKTLVKRVYSILDLILKPEQCQKCQEWMKPHIIITNSYKHEKIERLCQCQNEK